MDPKMLASQLRVGEARNVQHPRMYDLSRAIQKNPVSNFMLGGLADWMQTTAKGYQTKPMQNVMAGLDVGLPGLGKLAAAPLAGAAGLYAMHKAAGPVSKASRLAQALKGQQGIVAYHGSPHKFDQFDISKIGTGEGAQAYGHGLYIAENPAVAKEYSTQLGTQNKPIVVYDHPSYAGKHVVMRGEDVLSSHNSAESANRALSKLPSMQPTLYHVDIPDSAIDNMLDWDKPLSEQPENVRKALEPIRKQAAKSFPDLYAMDAKFGDKMTGGQLYKMYTDHRGGNSKAASDAIRELGIPGIKYLDQGSRSAGKGTRNFVVFDDKLIKILKRE